MERVFAAGESLMGDRIILFDNNRIQRFVLENDALAFSAVEDNFLCGGFPHLETDVFLHQS